MADIVAVIKAQHREMERLLEQAQEEDADRLALLRQVNDLLTPHSEAEESFVYPAIGTREPAEQSEVHDGVAEHHHIEGLMRELLSEDPDGPGYDGKLAAMVGELQHHVEEEEEELLPVLSDKASADERSQLAARFEAQTRWQEWRERNGSASDGEPTRAELYEKAKEQDVPGRSGMNKEELAEAVDEG